MSEIESLNIAEIRAQMANKVGRDYWERLGALSEDPTVKAFIESEEKGGPAGPQVTRRQLLKYMAASIALAGVNACTKQPVEKIFPYSTPPENLIPGKPLYFASALTRQGVARGVVVESHEGRPTKIEGNTLHPDSLGATDVFMQAEILNLYDPDRLAAVWNENEISNWASFVQEMRKLIPAMSADQGSGFRILTETVTSPSMGALMKALLAKFPEAHWHQFESAGRVSARDGALLSFGRPMDAIYHFDRAERIFSLDADFLNGQPGSLRYTREYVKGRQADSEHRNRLYVVEPTPTNTGAMADHRFTTRASDIENVADHLARLLGVAAASPVGNPPEWLNAAARDLQSRRGRALVVPGEYQSPRVHALAHAMNRALGSVGQTVEYIDSIEAEPIDQTASLRDLAKEIEAGKVSTLLILGGNPVFATPGDIKFGDIFKKVATRVYIGTHRDETARLCHWAIPQAHELETWGDARAFDGTASIQQPLIAPLYDGKSHLEVLSVFADASTRSAHDIVQEFWKSQGLSTDKWERAVQDGVIAGTAFTPRGLIPRDPPGRSAEAAPTMDIVFRPDPHIWDGRYANNGWLQELPKPITTLTWDNVAQISGPDARKWDVSDGDVLELSSNGRKIQAPAWVTPGQAEGSVTVALGYGRRYAGRIGSNTGFDAQALRDTAGLWLSSLSVTPTRKKYPLVKTQEHNKLEGRDLIKIRDISDRHAEAAAHAENAEKGAAKEAAEGEEPHAMIIPKMKLSEDYAWAMSIDLNACTGCNTCTIACQSENNIAIVGKKEVSRGREMHWIRIDRYNEGTDANPQLLHQPITCMQCENAPCEVVCPVEATVHSSEGLNEMNYNRCVGTRYCSNNCPYKVRRYNFFQYADLKTESLKMGRNPDVTTRVRGVMEKCTYCVQRINQAKIGAEKQNRLVKDGEIQTACQQACPAAAIVFGNLRDTDSAVSKLKTDPRNYALLTDLNTNPRTSYLARVRNRNPEIKDA